MFEVFIHNRVRFAFRLCQLLQKQGFKAYFAGGCVRDAILGKMPKDFDIATSALPEDVENILKSNNIHTVPVGRKFGIVVAQNPTDSEDVEIATFRQEDGYADGRRPDNVNFVTDPHADALRRDFTVNALFYDPILDQVLDYVQGGVHLRAKVLKCVGDANKRFSEDYLRILRALRFSIVHDFILSPETVEAMKANAWGLEHISQERITAEINHIVKDHDCLVKFLRALKAFPEIASAIGVYEVFDVDKPIKNELFTSPDVRWCEILTNIGFIKTPKDLKLQMHCNLQFVEGYFKYMRSLTVWNKLKLSAKADVIIGLGLDQRSCFVLFKYLAEAFNLDYEDDIEATRFEVATFRPTVTGDFLINSMGMKPSKAFTGIIKHFHDYELDNSKLTNPVEQVHNYLTSKGIEHEYSGRD